MTHHKNTYKTFIPSMDGLSWQQTKWAHRYYC
jgi:hypothetical protein